MAIKQTEKPGRSDAAARSRRFSWLGFKSRCAHALRDPSYRLAVAGGVVATLGFNPIPWDWMGLASWREPAQGLRVLIPLAPLIAFRLLQNAATPAQAERRLFMFGWVFYFGAINWLCSLALYNPVAPLGILFLGAFMACFLSFIGWLARRFFWTGHANLDFWTFAGLWILSEWVRTLGRLANPLGLLAHAWSPWPMLTQGAAVLGELGVSLLICLAAKCIDDWLQPGVRQAWRRAALSTGCFCGVLALSIILYAQETEKTNATDSKQPGAAEFHIVLLQPNIDQPTKLASYAHPDESVQAEIREHMTANQEDLLNRVFTPQPDLILFPESSFTHPGFNYDRAITARIAALARRQRAPLLVGGNRIVPGPSGGPLDYEIYNSMYFVNADGTFNPTAYDKMRLVPFGEDIPYLDIIPGLQSMTGIGSFNIGKRQTLFAVEGHAEQTSGSAAADRVGLQFGTLICFESTFSALGRGLVRAGADFIVVATNDGWYGRTAGAYQHFHMSQLRAVETRRWVLRCANTGISAIIAPSGQVVDHLALNQRGLLEHTLHFTGNQPTTLFARHGYAWLWLIPAWLAAMRFIRKRVGK